MQDVACFLILIPYFVDGVHIVWDNDVDVETNEIDYGRIGQNDEVRMPNVFMIYPGTKWCGAGNIANDYDDLGQFEDTDKCCRTHDYCEDIIEGLQTKYNLTNHAFYTRLNCECDELFRHCLKENHSYVSNQVGYVYFNVLGTQCFKISYPITRCVKFTPLPVKKCVEYEFDESQEPLPQWFDVPSY